MPEDIIRLYRTRGMTGHQRDFLAGTVRGDERIAVYEAHITELCRSAPLDPAYMVLSDPVFGPDHLRTIVDAEGDTLCVCPTPELAAKLCAYLNKANSLPEDVLVESVLRGGA